MATKTSTDGSVNGTHNRVSGIIEDQAPTIVIPKPKIRTVQIPIVGTTPLIMHKWSEKAIQMIKDKQGKKASGPKAAKDPEAEYNGARYVSVDGWDGVQAVAFKAAMVGACRQTDKAISMTLAQRLFFIVADGVDDRDNGLIRIIGEPKMHEAMVRVGMGVADIRYRPIYSPWSATLTVRFNAGMISDEQLFNLVQLAGLSEGVGEWRPSAPKSATGTYGCWDLAE